MWHRTFADGTTLEYDRGAHKLKVDVKGTANVFCTGTAVISSDAKLELSAPVILAKGTFVNTARDGSPGNAVISGNIKVLEGGADVAADVVASGVSLVSHTHDGVESGGSITGTPVAGGGAQAQPGASGGECEDDCTQATAESVIPCLSKIAWAMAEIQTDEKDRLGWQYLSAMFDKWLSSSFNDDAQNCREPFWIEWAWAMRFERAQYAYEKFTQKGGADGTIYSDAAKETLGKRLKEQGIWPTEGASCDFDFISEKGWRKWKDTYFNFISVPGTGLNFSDTSILAFDGLATALSSCTIRALAAGRIESLIGGGWRITVTRVAVFLHDLFNFEGEAGGSGGLGWWSCQRLDGAKRNPSDETYALLYNASFRAWREKHGMGGDFLVLSLPHEVESFEKTIYDISISMTLIREDFDAPF